MGSEWLRWVVFEQRVERDLTLYASFIGLAVVAHLLAYYTVCRIYRVGSPRFLRTGPIQRLFEFPVMRSHIGRALLSYGITMILFMIAYYRLATIDHSAFNVGQLSVVSVIYFTVITAATVGYGDICPASSVAKMLVAYQICFSGAYTLFVFSAIISTIGAKESDDAHRT